MHLLVLVVFFSSSGIVMFLNKKVQNSAMQKNTHTHKHHINLKVFKGTKVSKLRSNMLAGDWGEGEEEEGGESINKNSKHSDNSHSSAKFNTLC